MKLFGCLLITLICSCEYDSKINVTRKVPVKLYTRDESNIKNISISIKGAGETNYINLIDIDLPEGIKEVLLDSLIAKNKQTNLIEVYLPGAQYSVIVKTTKGIGGLEFYVDSYKKVVVTLIK